VGIGTATPNASLHLNGSLAIAPAPVSLASGAQITAANLAQAMLRIQGSGGAYPVLLGTPQIVAGIDGQMLILIGASPTNTVKLVQGTGLRLAGGVSFTFTTGDILVLLYDASTSLWTEVSRSSN